MTRYLFVTLLLAVLTAPAAADEKYYQWLDEDGVTTYGEQPPQGVPAREIRTRIREIDDGATADRFRHQQEAANRRTRERSASETREDRCAAHRHNLSLLEGDSDVTTQDVETGEVRLVNSEERQRMLEQTRNALEMCLEDEGR